MKHLRHATGAFSLFPMLELLRDICLYLKSFQAEGLILSLETKEGVRHCPSAAEWNAAPLYTQSADCRAGPARWRRPRLIPIVYTQLSKTYTRPVTNGWFFGPGDKVKPLLDGRGLLHATLLLKIRILEIFWERCCHFFQHETAIILPDAWSPLSILWTALRNFVSYDWGYGTRSILSILQCGYLVNWRAPMSRHCSAPGHLWFTLDLQEDKVFSIFQHVSASALPHLTFWSITFLYLTPGSSSLYWYIFTTPKELNNDVEATSRFPSEQWILGFTILLQCSRREFYFLAFHLPCRWHN